MLHLLEIREETSIFIKNTLSIIIFFHPISPIKDEDYNNIRFDQIKTP